jgi:hypothetical protein
MVGTYPAVVAIGVIGTAAILLRAFSLTAYPVAVLVHGLKSDFFSVGGGPFWGVLFWC